MATSIGEIQGTLSLRDQFTRTLERATSKLEKSAQKIERTGRKLSSAGTSLSAAVTLPIVAIGGGAIKAFADFDGAMSQSLAIMGNVSDAMRDKMAKSAREMAKVTSFSAKQAAESFYFLASAGLSAEQSVAALPRVAAFAQAGMFDMARATDLLTDAQSALGLTIRDDVVANMENMERVSDVLVRAATLANASVEQFSTSLTSMAGSALKNANKSIEEGVAVLAAFADQGVKAELAGNALDRILRLMTDAAIKNEAAYKKWDVTVFDSQGNIRNFADIIGDLEKAFADLSPKVKQAALNELGFAARVQGVIKPLIGTSEAIRDYEKKLRSAQGTTEEVANKQLEAFGQKMKLIKDRMIDAAITLGTNLAPTIEDFGNSVLVPTIKLLGKLAEWFGKIPQPIRKFIIAAFALAAALGPVLFVGGQLITAFGLMAKSARFLATTFYSLTGPIGLVVLALIALREAADSAIDRWRKASESGIAAIIDAQDRARASVAALREDMKDGIVSSDVFEDAVNAAASLSFGIQGTEREIERLQKAFDDLDPSGVAPDAFFLKQQKIKNQIAEANEKLRNQRAALNIVEKALLDARDATIEYTTASDGMTPSVIDATATFEDLDKAIEAANKRIEEHQDKIQEIRDFYEELRDIQDAVEEEFEELAGSFEVELPPIDLEMEDVTFVDWADLEKQHKEYVKKIAEQLEEDYAKAQDAVMEQAWQNVQDIATDAIAEIVKSGEVDFDRLGDAILEIFANVLTKLLLMWAANVAKRIALERSVAAASGGFSGGGGGGGWLSAIGSLFGGGGGGAAAGAGGTYAADAALLDAAAGGGGGGGAFAGAGAAVGALAIAGVAVAVAAYVHSQAAKRAAKRWFQTAEIRDGWSAIFGDEEVVGFASEIQRQIARIFEQIGGSLESLPGIQVEAQASGKRFRSYIEGELVGVFATFEEAFRAAALEAIQRSDLAGVAPELAEAIASGSIASLDQLSEVADVFGRINQATNSVGADIRKFLAEIERMGQVLADAGISASVLSDYTAQGWDAIRRSITGATLSAEELFEQRRKQFNQEVSRLKALAEQQLAAAQASAAAAQAEVSRVEALIASVTVTTELTQHLVDALSRAQQALTDANAAVSAAQGEIDALPDLIGPGEFRGGGGASRRQAELERLNETLDRMALERLPAARRAIAEFEVQWEQLRLLAGQNADALARVNEEYRIQAELLRQQITEDLFAGIREFESDPNASPFARGMQSILDEGNRLEEEARDWAAAMAANAEEAGKFFDEARRLALALDRITEAEHRRLQALGQQEGDDLLLSMLDFLGMSEEAERLRFEISKAELQVRYAQLQAAVQEHDLQIDALEAMGALVADIAEIDFEQWRSIRAGGSSGGGGTRGTNPVDEAMRLLRQYQTSFLSPFEQEIKRVVDDFAKIRSAIGWTTEVQEAYAQAIQDVIDRALEPIRRLQEELTFRPESSVRSIDQFRAAQTRANDIIAALRSGDLSQLQDLPDALRRVLDLNISAQGSSATRFLEEWVNRMLQEAQDLAQAAGEDILPGPTDPFAWLRDEPTAGDRLIADTIAYWGWDLGGRQDETTDAVVRSSIDIADDIAEVIRGLRRDDQIGERTAETPTGWHERMEALARDNRSLNRRTAVAQEALTANFVNDFVQANVG